MFEIILFGIIVTIFLTCFVSCLKIVKSPNIMIVRRLGKISKVSTEGVCFLLPFGIDEGIIIPIERRLIKDLKEKVMTEDKVHTEFTLDIHWIIDLSNDAINRANNILSHFTTIEEYIRGAVMENLNAVVDLQKVEYVEVNQQLIEDNLMSLLKGDEVIFARKLFSLLGTTEPMSETDAQKIVNAIASEISNHDALYSEHLRQISYVIKDKMEDGKTARNPRLSWIQKYNKIRKLLDFATQKKPLIEYGIRIIEINLKDIEPDKRYREAQQNQKYVEQEIAAAQKQKELQKLKGEAAAEFARNKAQGEADAIKLVMGARIEQYQKIVKDGKMDPLSIAIAEGAQAIKEGVIEGISKALSNKSEKNK